MKIGEMFVEIGLTGQAAFTKTIGAVTKSFGAAADGANAFLGVSKKVYGAIDGYVAPIAKAGAQLYQFEQATGISMVTLQKWQKEMLNFGVQGDVVQQSFMNLQRAVNTMIMGGGVPKNMALIFQRAGVDLNRIRDTTYLMEKMMGIAKTMDVGIGQTLFENLVGPEMYQAMRRSTADIQKITGDFYTPEQGKALERVNVMWDKMKYRAEKAFGGIIANHGPKLIQQITVIIDKLVKMIDQLVILGEKLGVFKILEKTFDGISMAMQAMKAFFEYLDGMLGKGKGSLFEKGLKLLDPFLDKWTEKVAKMIYPTPELLPSPVAGMAVPFKGSQSNTMTFNQTITATGDAETVKKAVASGTTSGIRQAGAQMPSVTRKN